jgi:exoribonuclease R
MNNRLEKLDVKLIKALIVNKRSFTYDEAQISDDISELYMIGQKLFDVGYHKRLSINLNPKYDTHTMVEIFMVLANVEVANMLIRYIPHLAIIRSHKGIKQNQTIMEQQSDNVNMMNAIAIVNRIKMERAVYAIYNDTGDNQHVGLGEMFYTHFTSPIRRYADITIHRLL